MTTALPMPPDGGRYLRDPKTGRLTRLDEEAGSPEQPLDDPAPVTPAERKGDK